ncbi:MAG: hypothetical protein AB8B63_00420 [Granulosicoccus sp.]
MPKTVSPVFFYASLMEPWSRLAIGTPAVIAMRITTLPLLWMSDPGKAARETQKMFSEKPEAVGETLMVVMQAPMRFWFDTMAACLSANPQSAIASAMIDSSRRAARPSNRRVRANRKRLGKRN